MKGRTTGATSALSVRIRRSETAKRGLIELTYSPEPLTLTVFTGNIDTYSIDLSGRPIMTDLVQRHGGVYSMVENGQLSSQISANALRDNVLIFKTVGARGRVYMDTFQLVEAICATLREAEHSLAAQLHALPALDFEGATQAIRDLYKLEPEYQPDLTCLKNILEVPELSVDVFGHVRTYSNCIQLCPTSGEVLSTHPWLCVCFALLYACHPLACAASVVAVSEADPSTLEKDQALAVGTMIKCLDPDEFIDCPKLKGLAYPTATALVRDYFLSLELSPLERRMLDLIPDNDLVEWATDDALVDFVRVAGYCYALEV